LLSNDNNKVLKSKKWLPTQNPQEKEKGLPTPKSQETSGDEKEKTRGTIPRKFDSRVNMLYLQICH